MNILNITFKDLQIFFKNRGSSLQLFVLPLVFIFVFSGIGSIDSIYGNCPLAEYLC